MTTTTVDTATAAAACTAGIPPGLTADTCPHTYSSDGATPPPGQTGQWWHCNVCDVDYPDVTPSGSR